MKLKLLIIHLFLFIFSFSQTGQLDNSFGVNGIAKYQGAYGTSISLDKNGRIVAGGYDSRNNFTKRFTFARFLANGSLDTTFDNDGASSIVLNAVDVYLSDIAIQSDNKIIACGYIENSTNRKDFIVLRLNENGSLDTTFNANGIVTISFGTGADEAHSLAIQQDGKILVAGNSFTGSYFDYSVARLNIDGSLDSTFSGDGKLVVDIAGNNDYANNIAIDPNGKIYVTGNSYSNGVFCDFSICKINADGSLDTSFSTDGKLLVKISSNSNDEAFKIFFPSDGKIILTGEIATGTGAVKLLPNGNLDTAFGNNGIFAYRFGTNVNYPNASSAMQADGKIVLGAPYDAGGYRDVGLLRITTSGQIDTTFGTNGTTITTLGNSPDLYQMELQNDNKIVMVGNLDGINISVARYNNTSNLNVVQTETTTPSFYKVNNEKLIFKEQIEQIEVYSINGQKISVLKNSKTLPINFLTNGKYFVKMTDKGKVIIDSFIKN